MSAKYKVSVIIPIYNVAEYLEECLESMVRQTIDSLEVIMVDDGSTDISGVIAQEYAKNYDNFFYYLKENGGLGNARNYGIQFVHGDYIIFLDSDDIVPDGAYEAMYKKAVETGNDMVVGDVQRFNSRKKYNSGLHRKAFRDAYDKTTILETPQLIYDTTSWNKLIKFSFWKEHDFKFPEKILYEDIPVTMPLHFYANAVSVLNEIVYLWRERDGANKSITQNRTEMKNFTDRVKIMHMVDDFYNAHVSDDHALYMKDYKWMSVDLKLYIQEMLTADDEFIDYAMDVIREYMKDFRKDSFQDLQAIDRMKYHLIETGNKKRLLELLAYEKGAYRTLKIKRKKVNGEMHYIGDFPFHDFPEEYYDMTKELRLYPETRSLQQVYWNDNKLIVKGYSFIQRLTCSSKHAQQLKANLLNVATKESVSVPLTVCKANGVRGRHGLKVDKSNRKARYYNYKWSGFEIEIDFSRPEIQKIANGILKVELQYDREGIHTSFYAGGPVSGSDARPKYLNVKDTKVLPYYNLGYDLCLNCESLDVKVQQLTVTDHELIVKTQLSKETLICKSDDAVNELKVKQENDMQSAVLDLNAFHADHGVIMAKGGKALSSNDLRLSRYAFTTDQLIRVYSDDAGYMNLAGEPHRSVLTRLYWAEEQIGMEVETRLSNADKLKTAYFELKGESSSLTMPPVTGKINVQGSSVTAAAIIPICDDAFTKNMVADKWKTYIIYEFEDGSVQKHTIAADAVAQLSRKPYKDYYYSVYPNMDLDMIVKVTRKWKWYESNKLRRKFVELFIYPMLRMLPVRKKRIVFEGWWGQKFHCNPKAFYKYMDKEHPDYTCIWSLVDERTPIEGNGIRVRRKSLRYHYYMATSKYFVNNVNFMESFKKRKKQVEVQTMHGTPLKTLGLDVPGELPTEEARQKFIKKCSRWDYLVVQSSKAESITSSCYAFKKEFLKTGYPRNDVLFAKNNEKDITDIKKKLGISPEKKVIMYAPTWRVRNQFNMKIDIKKKKKQIQDDYVLMLRIHPFAVKGLKEDLLDEFVINVSNYPSVEELYLASDIVITDYSSVMFDYAILNRPMLFFTYDLEDYRDTLRGFNFDFVAEAPGPLLKTSDEVIQSIVNIDKVAQEHDEALQKFRKKFCEYEKGTASEQIFQRVMQNQ